MVMALNQSLTDHTDSGTTFDEYFKNKIDEDIAFTTMVEIAFQQLLKEVVTITMYGCVQC